MNAPGLEVMQTPGKCESSFYCVLGSSCKCLENVRAAFTVFKGS